jgi:hypothetical protein
LEDLKASIVKAWRGLSKAYIVKTCLVFWRRLETVIDMEGGLIKK